MSPGCVAVVRYADRLVAGRVVVVRAPAFVRVELALPDGPQLVRVAVDDVVAVLHSRAADDAEVRRRVTAAHARAPHDQLAVAWQLLGEQPCGTGEVARLVCGDDDSVARDDVILAAGLADDAFRLDRGQLLRRGPAERAQLQQQRVNDAALGAKFAAWQHALAQISIGGRPSTAAVADMGAQLAGWLADAAAHPDVAAWLAKHTAAGHGPPHTAAQWMVQLGLWDAHDEPALHQSGLLQPAPEPGPLPAAPLPATAPTATLQWITLDNAAPHEIDDAIALHTEGQGHRLHVAIAHPTAWMHPGDATDLAARQRGATLYHPRHVVPMLPDSLAQAAAGLHVGQRRPALVFSAHVASDGAWSDPHIAEQWLTVHAAWQYTAVDRWLGAADCPSLAEQLWQVAQAMERQRIAQGAWLLYKPEFDVRAPRHGAVTLYNASQSSPARRIVTEAMVLAGSIAARFASDHHLAVPFRAQPPPVKPPHPPGYYSDPAQVFEVLRTLQPALTALHPAPHTLIGVPAYCQVTSPLRRYTDIVAHYQLVALLRHTKPLTDAALNAMLAPSDAAVGKIRHWQRGGERYFKLLWLAGQPPGAKYDAQVVRTLASGALLFLPALALEVPVRTRRLDVGQWLSVTVHGVAPQQNQLDLRITD